MSNTSPYTSSPSTTTKSTTPTNNNSSNGTTYTGSNGNTVYSTDSGGLSAPVISNGNGTYTGGVANPTYSSVVNGKQTNTPASQYQAPQLNIPSFQAPTYNQMSFDQAKGQVQQQLDPLYQQALANIQKTKYQNQLNAGELAQNKGLAHSGLAADLQNKVNIQAQQDAANADTDKTAKIAQMAQALQQQDFNNYNTNYQNALNTWMNQSNMAINQYKTANDIAQWKQQYQAQQQQNAFNQKLQEAMVTGRFYLD